MFGLVRNPLSCGCWNLIGLKGTTLGGRLCGCGINFNVRQSPYECAFSGGPQFFLSSFFIPPSFYCILMARLLLSVPEAAASSDTIQFKLILAGPVRTIVGTISLALWTLIHLGLRRVYKASSLNTMLYKLLSLGLFNRLLGYRNSFVNLSRW